MIAAEEDAAIAGLLDDACGKQAIIRVLVAAPIAGKHPAHVFHDCGQARYGDKNALEMVGEGAVVAVGFGRQGVKVKFAGRRRVQGAAYRVTYDEASGGSVPPVI